MSLFHLGAEADQPPPHCGYYATPCSCGRCKHWHVSDVADIQGVSFTELQARAVADLLNRMPPPQ